MPALRLETGGQTLILTAFTNAGVAQNLYTDSAQSQLITFPIAAGVDTTYYYNDAVTATCQLAVSEANGIPLGSYNVQAYPGGYARVAPRMSQAQLEAAIADSGVAGLHGFLAQAFDPALASTGFLLTPAGTVFTTKVIVPSAAPVTNVVVEVTVVGATLTASQCLIGLYGPTGALIGVAPSQDVAWVSTGVKAAALTGGPFTIQPGLYTVAYFFNGTTGPTLAAGASQAAGAVNAGLSAANSRFGTADTGRTTTLAATLGALTASTRSIWAALS